MWHRPGDRSHPSDLRLLDMESIVVSRNRSVSCVDIELWVVSSDGGILEPNRQADNGCGIGVGDNIATILAGATFIPSHPRSSTFFHSPSDLNVPQCFTRQAAVESVRVTPQISDLWKLGEARCGNRRYGPTLHSESLFDVSWVSRTQRRLNCCYPRMHR